MYTGVTDVTGALHSQQGQRPYLSMHSVDIHEFRIISVQLFFIKYFTWSMLAVNWYLGYGKVRYLVTCYWKFKTKRDTTVRMTYVQTVVECSAVQVERWDHPWHSAAASECSPDIHNSK